MVFLQFLVALWENILIYVGWNLLCFYLGEGEMSSFNVPKSKISKNVLSMLACNYSLVHLKVLKFQDMHFVSFYLEFSMKSFQILLHFILASPNARTAAIYYFITALFILLACVDTYFALPLIVSNCTQYFNLNSWE